MATGADELAARVVHGAQERLVEALTREAADMMAEAVRNPDRYAVLARLAPGRLMAVLAERRDEVSEDVARAVGEALEQSDDEVVELLSRGRDGEWVPADGHTAGALERAAQAERGISEIVARQNVALADNLAAEWHEAVGEAVTSVGLGGSRREAMERACSRLAGAGVTTIDYASGRRCSVDAAVRRHVVTQASRARAEMTLSRCREYGHDLVFVSSHYGCRPTHEWFQGRVFSLSGAASGTVRDASGRREAVRPISATGYGTAGGLCGANCGHRMFPFVPGLSELPDREFASQREEFGRTGAEEYALTQRQRAMEREVRARKRAVAVGQAQGLPMVGERYALGRAQARLRTFCAANRLTRDPERERAYGVGEQPRGLTSEQHGVSFEESRAEKKRRRREEYPRTQRAAAKIAATTAADLDKAGWNAYARKVASVSSPSIADMVVRDSRAILRRRSGTRREELVYYDETEGRRLGSALGPSEGSKVNPTARMRQRAEAAAVRGHSVVTLHNHPGSTLPSLADVASLMGIGGSYGLIAAHDGSVYRYEVVGEPVAGYSLAYSKRMETRWGSFIANRKRDPESGLLAEIERTWGVRIVHLA